MSFAPDITAAIAAGGITESPSGLVLAGIGPPQIPGQPGPPDLDGINDPWRRDLNGPQWYSAAYSITWEAGDTLPSIGSTYQVSDGESHWNLPPSSTPTPTWHEYKSGASVSVIGADDLLTFTEGGAGVLGMYVTALDTPPEDPSIDVTTLFGSDVVVIGPYEFPAATGPTSVVPGADGYYYFDMTNLYAPVAYGPKVDGDWGAGAGG